MRSSSSPSADVAGASYDVLRRRLVESSLRAEIIATVNSARTEAEVAEAVTGKLAEAFDAEVAFLVVARAGGAPPLALAARGLTEAHRERLLRHPRVIAALERGEGDVLAGGPIRRGEGEVLMGGPMGGGEGEVLAGGLAGPLAPARLLGLAPFRTGGGDLGLLGVARLDSNPLDEAEVALLEAVAESTGHGLERCWLAAERERQAAQQAALARAAKSLNAPLERDEILQRLLAEISLALGADIVLVSFAAEEDGLTVVAALGVADEFVGLRSPGDGLDDLALRLGTVQVTNAYLEEGHNPPSTAALRGVQRAASAPLRRQGGMDGVLWVGWKAPERWLTPADEHLLAAFAELAGVACRNADERRAATLDPLTGCLNHAGFQERLRGEASRAERGGEPFSLVLLDLDDFEGVNERHGHLAGDTVLRTLGAILRGSVRLHDHVARLGGDKFALLLPATDAATARCVVARSLEAIARTPALGGTHLFASAGVAEWVPGSHATQLIAAADDALRASKRTRPGRVSVREPGQEADPRERRTRRLATAGTIGARLARLGDPEAIAGTAALELRRAFGYGDSTLLRLADDGRLVPVTAAGAGEPRAQDEGAVGRALRERRPVLVDVPAQGGGEAQGARLAVPVFAGSSLWGAVELRSHEPAAFDEDDAQVAQTVADHVGAALRTAELYRTLEETHLGTAQALAAALEAKDNYTADHARSMADLAVETGAALGFDDASLRDLRLGAIFHDIGKIAVPDAILNKRGPLTAEEFEVVKRHPLVGEQILAPVPFLRDVRSIVRHDHERWDGAGYPDGLRDSDIPIGARVVFVVDAYHAMTSDRPYRVGMPASAALAEVEAHAGSQFDPRIVSTFLGVLARRRAAPR